MGDIIQYIKDNSLYNLLAGIGSIAFTAFIWPKNWYLLGPKLGQPLAYAVGALLTGMGVYGIYLNSQTTKAHYANTINPYYQG